MQVDMTALKQMGENDLKELGIPMVIDLSSLNWYYFFHLCHVLCYVIMLQGLEFQLNIQPHIRRRTWSLDWPSLVTCILNVIFQPWQMLPRSCIMNHMLVVNLGSLLLFICYSLLLLLLICLQQGQVREQGVITLYAQEHILGWFIYLFVFNCCLSRRVQGKRFFLLSYRLVPNVNHDIYPARCRSQCMSGSPGIFWVTNTHLWESPFENGAP